MIKNIGRRIKKYQGELIAITEQLVKFPSGKEVLFEFAERPPGVRVLVTNGESILLTKEWRQEIRGWDYRLPGGKVFDKLTDYIDFISEGEDIHKKCILSAQKELKEEANIDIESSRFVQFYISRLGSTIVWDLYYFIVLIPDLHISRNEIITKEEENVITFFYPKSKVKELCINGDIKEERTAFVILKYIIDNE